MGGKSSKTIYLLPSSSLGSPRARLQAMPGLGGSARALVAVKGVNTQVPTMNALRGLPRPAGNYGHREFGLKSGFVFRMTPIWQNSDYSTSNA